MASQKAPAVPRPSASLIVVNPRNEVLLVHRNPKSGTFAGMHVSVVSKQSFDTSHRVVKGVPWR